MFFTVMVTVMITRSMRWTAIALASMLLGTALATLPSTAARYRPPSAAAIQRPAGRQGAATRTDCAKDNFTFAAVVPTSNYGQTTADYPTLYWYHANHTFSWARFELYAAQAQTFQLEPDPIYQTTFRLMGSPAAFASLTLPSSTGLPPLEKDRDYLWKVTLICSQKGPEDETASGSQRSVQGWITRVAPSADVQAKLATAPRRHEVYTEEGLWYDAIHDLAVQQRQRPQQPHLAADWQELLQETTLRSIKAAMPY
jgi:Domain of Unknown Function (DUF928)